MSRSAAGLSAAITVESSLAPRATSPPLDVRLLGAALAAWIAVAALLGAPGWLVGALALTAALGSGITMMRGGRTASVIGLALAAMAILLASTLAQRAVRSAGTMTDLAEQGASVRVVATVASDPLPLPATGPRRTPMVVVRLQVHEVVGRGNHSRVRSPVLAFADPSWSDVRWGERVEVRGRLAPAARGDDVLATLDAKGAPLVLGEPGALRRAAGRLRAGLQRAVRGGPREGSGLLPGLVLGDTSRLDPALDVDMRASGLTHLVAVSGSNVAIVAGSVLWLAGRLGLARRWRPWAAGLAVAGFVVVARPEPSVLRAAVMGGVALIGLASARRSQGIPPLSAAVLILLVADPWLARSYGFALSVLASLGLLLLARPLADWLGRWLPRLLALAIAVPLAAQAACGPVIVLLQGSVSLASIPSNLAAAPLVAPATVLGVLAAMSSVAWPAAAGVLGWTGAWVGEGIAAIAHLGARVPPLPWSGGTLGALALAGLTVVALVGTVPIARACARHPWAAAVFAPALLAVVWPIGSVAWPPRGWVMVICDVGQGDGLVLSSAPHHAVVVDTGPDPGAMDRCLRRLAIRVIDLLVLTHDHADHVEGVPGVLRGRRVSGLLLNGLDDPPAEAARIAGWVARARLTVRTAQVGQVGQVGEVSYQVLWPRWVIHEGSVPNNDSIVLLVQSHGLRLLLLGDVETAAARQVALALAQAPGGSHVDVLKVAHHGSALQDPGLIAAAGAPLAVISVGAGNVYGHPARSTIDRLAGSGATIRRTDQDGDIAVVAVDGRPATVTTRR